MTHRSMRESKDRVGPLTILATYRWWVLVQTIVLPASLLLPQLAAGQTYDFVSVADNSGPYLAFDAPAINDLGMAAFSVTFDPGGPGTAGIAKGPNPLSDMLVDVGGPMASFTGVNINNSGTIAFRASLGGGSAGIFTGPGVVSDAVATNAGPFSSFGLSPALNDAGTVVFRAAVGGGDSGIFTGPDLVTDAFVVTTASPFVGVDAPAISQSGTIAFRGFLPGSSGIFTGPDPVADAVVTNAGPYATLAEPAINDSGTVVFRATLDGGGAGVFTGPDPVADTVATTASGHFLSFERLAINNAGTIAFGAQLAGGGSAVYTGPDPIADRVIGTGDAMFGSSVAAVGFESSGLNELNEIGFFYQLANGVQGVGVRIVSHRYTADTSGSFDNPADFAFGATPKAVVPTYITPANGAVITGPAANATIRSLDLGTAGSGVAELRLVPGGHLTVNESLHVQSQGKLRIDGAATALGGILNTGEIQLVNGAHLNGGTLVNTGLLRGDGSVGNAVTNQGLIEAIGTAFNPVELSFLAPVKNVASTGLITARNSIIRFNSGLENNGSVGLSFGTTDVFGDIDNTGTMVIGGGGQVTFYDDIVQNGVFQVAAAGGTTSVAVLFGSFSGAGGFIGGGDVFVLGDLRPGNSPASVTYDGNMFLGSSTNTFIELGGTGIGQFDQLLVSGKLGLAGALEVSTIDGFALGFNQQFAVAEVEGMLDGQFFGLAEGALVGNFDGVDLFISYAAPDGSLGVTLYTVPEPGSMSLVLAMLGLGLPVGRRIFHGG